VSAPTVRPATEDEFATWHQVVRTAMLGSTPTAEQTAAYRSIADLQRTLAAFDDRGQLCGTARTFATELTVPGGVVPAGAVTSVGVLPTHRRQGHLTRLMETQLAQMLELGEPVAVLIAAEYPIYGRYGYGPGTEGCLVHIDADPPLVWGPGNQAPTGSVRMVTTEEMAPALTELYDRARLRSAGHITYSKDHWAQTVGAEPWPDGDDEKRRNAWKVLWTDDDGQVQGAVVYEVDQSWAGNRPQGTLQATLLVSATDEAERELVRYLTLVDWVSKVRLHLRPIDDPVPLWLSDGRRARLSQRSDHIWARVLDVPAALTARTYGCAGRLVVEVVDPMGFAAGRFLLDASPAGATCTATTSSPDLTLSASALSAAYLGGFTVDRLAAAGGVDEHRAGAIASASALFAAARAPWNAVTF
jgi:predicted acetyltransferase